MFCFQHLPLLPSSSLLHSPHISLSQFFFLKLLFLHSCDPTVRPPTSVTLALVPLGATHVSISLFTLLARSLSGVGGMVMVLVYPSALNQLSFLFFPPDSSSLNIGFMNYSDFLAPPFPTKPFYFTKEISKYTKENMQAERFGSHFSHIDLINLISLPGCLTVL